MAADLDHNSPGWQVTDIGRLRRFLCYGAEGNVCHSTGKLFSVEQVQSLCRLIEEGQGEEIVKEIIAFTGRARTTRSEALVFSLAVCARSATDLKTKQAAYNAVEKVCQNPALLFHFVNFAEKLSGEHTGWGRAQRRAINKWYNNQDTAQLAFAVTKYKQRHGWSHTDLLRLAHVKPNKDTTALILKYVIKGLAEARKEFSGESSEEMQQLLRYLEAVDAVKHSTDELEVALLIEEYHLCKEHVPTGLLNSKEIWRALLHQMPLRELVPQLGRLTALGLLDPLTNNNHTQVAINRLMNDTQVIDSRIHPFVLLSALRTYETGKAEKGKLKWMPNGAIIDALNAAYYTAFKNVSATGKRFLVAVDVSSTLTFGSVNGCPQVRPLLIAAAIAQLVSRLEQNYQLVSYSQSVTPLCLTPQMSIQEVVKCLAEVTRQVPTMGSDCSMPLQWALDNKKAVDVFVVVTDCETLSGQVHPVHLIKKYRKEMDLNDTRLIVCALTSHVLSVADPNDAGMLDVIGFDDTTPDIIHSFASGML